MGAWISELESGLNEIEKQVDKMAFWDKLLSQDEIVRKIALDFFPALLLEWLHRCPFLFDRAITDLWTESLL